MIPRHANVGGGQGGAPRGALVLGRALALAIAAGAAAQTHWHLDDGLSGSYWPAFVHDPVRGQTVLFGGARYFGSALEALGGTWLFAGGQWVAARPAHEPPPRAGAAFCFDAARGHVVLFGGYPLRFDTWEWDGTDWTERFAVTVPLVAEGGAMAFDAARGRSVMVAPNNGGQETWEWDGANWQIGNAGWSLPAFAILLGYDPVLGRVLLHTAARSVGGQASTWDWNGAVWSQRGTGGPQIVDAGMCWDPVTQRMLVVRGEGTAASGEQWSYDRVQWIQANPVVAPYRMGVRPVTDAAAGRVRAFGGASGLGSDFDEHSDTWEWDGAAWTRVLGEQAPPHSRSGMALAPATGELVVAGGQHTAGRTFVGNRVQWREIAAGPGPGDRRAPLLASDWRTGGVLLFGGFDWQTNAARTDTWLWTGNHWQLQAPAQVPGALLLAMAGNPTTGNVLAVDATQTWEWNGTDWLPVAAHPPLFSANVAYDRHRQRMVLFGQTQPRVPVTLEWDGATWSTRTPLQTPPGRFGHGMAYDEARRRVVITGGDTGISSAGDTWEWDGADWTLRLFWSGYDTAPPGPTHLAYRSATATIEAVDANTPNLWHYGPDAPATVAAFGAGCAGSVGVPQLTASTLPWLGDALAVEVRAVPAATTVVVVVIGSSAATWNGAPLPFDLGLHGMPGCAALVALEQFCFGPSQGGAAAFALAIPNAAGLLGLDSYLQAFVPDGNANAFGGVVTAALAVRIGAR